MIRFPSRSSCVLAVVLCWLSLPSAVRALDATLRACSSQAFPQIFLSVEVTEGGVSVPGLTRDDFECRENNVLQTELFDVGQSTGVRLADIVFVIDSSGSMGPEIDDVRANVKSFANQLVASGVDFRLGLVGFGQAANGGLPIVFNGGNLTDDLVLFEGLIDALPADGGNEPGFLALGAVLGLDPPGFELPSEGFNFRPGSQRHAILVTDEDADEPRDIKQDVIDLLIANDFQVHAHVDCEFNAPSIPFATATPDYCDDTSVRGATGGLLSAVTDPFDSIRVLIEMRIASTYVISYRSSNPVLDGSQRDVECTVTNAVPATVSCSYVPGEVPRIELTPETEQLLSQPLTEGSTPTLSVFARDNIAPTIQSVKLVYRTTGSGVYTSLDMNAVGGDRYEVALPTVSTPGVDFYVTASDGISTVSLPTADPGLAPFQIAVLPNVAPAITHTPIPTAPAGSPIDLAAEAVDTTNSLATVELRWRRIGELAYASIPMTPVGGDGFEATIPGGQVSKGIQYYLRAVDDLGVASTHATPDDPHLIGLTCSGSRIPEAITDFGSCGPVGRKTATWGRFQSRSALVADSGERLELECVDLGGGFLTYRLLYTRPGGSPLRVGVSPFQTACASAYFFHSGDGDGNGQPDCLLGTNWVARDYGANDQFDSSDPPCVAGINPWTGTCEENENLLDHAISVFSTNTNDLMKIDRKYEYAIAPPLPANACSDASVIPEGKFVGDLVVDPQLGPITEAFFNEAEMRLQSLPLDGPVQESPAPLCDYDGDGDCDPADLEVLLADEGKSVEESLCGAPCDLDGDGIITELDARQFRLLCTDIRQCKITISIDVRPGEGSTPVNPGARGVVPVAILGSESFDVRDVDTTTLAFGPGAAGLAHPPGHIVDLGSDGFEDLLGHYRVRAAGIPPDATEVCLTGETLDGTPFEGCDGIRIVPQGRRCGVGFELVLLLLPLAVRRVRLRRPW